MQERRRVYLVDKETQGRIARRLVGIWLIGGLLILVFPVAVNLVSAILISSITPEAVFRHLIQTIWFPACTALLVIPIGLRHSIKFSNRIAGPVYRFRTEMNNLLDGNPVRPIKLRNGDFFVDLTNDFNRLAERFQELEAQQKRASSDASKANEEQADTPKKQVCVR